MSEPGKDCLMLRDHARINPQQSAQLLYNTLLKVGCQGSVFDSQQADFGPQCAIRSIIRFYR